MIEEVPESELFSRQNRFRILMDNQNPDWKLAVIFSKINIYYFTGTMPDGMLIIPRNKDATLWIRRSFERAMDESLLPDIRTMDSFRDAASQITNVPDTVYLETEIVPLAMFQRFQKYFPFKTFKSLDYQVAMTRAVKSGYELAIMEKAGTIHQRILEERVPEILTEGMSEADFAGILFKVMMDEGHHGVMRFGMFDTECGMGHLAFGESSIYPTCFNGPGGNYGNCPAVPLFGSRERKLKKGDLVFIDIAVGVDGYHTDKTCTYMFGTPLPDKAMEAHYQCVTIQNKMAGLLKPGNIPSQIYESIIKELSPDFLENFMGYGKRQVKFLGHGIGLTIDELPVLAKGFDEPLKENMVFALEPKKGIKDIGMVGIENTFIVTPTGGRCITGDNPGLIPV